jgi:hypothetical protein
VLVHYKDATKGMCEKEFIEFKNCVQQVVSCAPECIIYTKLAVRWVENGEISLVKLQLEGPTNYIKYDMVHPPTIPPGMLGVRVSLSQASSVRGSPEARCCCPDSYLLCIIATNRVTGEAFSGTLLVLWAVLGNGRSGMSEGGRGSDGDW